MIFGPGTPDDYPAIEALLAQTDMPGWISLSYQADLAQAAGHPDGVTHLAIARDGDQVVATASCTTLPSPQGPISWIGGLRIAATHRGKPGLMRQGLDAIRAHLLADPPDWQLAAVLQDNLPAKALLTRKRDNFPTFTPLIDYTTFAMRPVRGAAFGVRQADIDDSKAIAARLSREDRPLSPRFDPHDNLSTWRGLGPEDFLVAEENGQLVGLAAIWDQRASRRYVVTDYAPSLRRLRPLWNVAAPITGQPHLPPVGQPLSAAFLSFLTADTPEIARRLIRAGLGLARQRGIGVLNLGLANDDPLYPHVASAFRHQTYRSTFYGVTWPGGRKLPPPAFFAQSKVELALL